MRRNNICGQYVIVRLCIYNVNKQNLVKLKATKLIKHKPQEPVATRKPPRSTAANTEVLSCNDEKNSIPGYHFLRAQLMTERRVDSEQPIPKYSLIQSFVSKLEDSCFPLGFQVWILTIFQNKT